MDTTSSQLIGALAVFLGGCVQGCTGFGFAIVSAPFMLMIMPPTTAVPLLCFLSLLNTTSLTVHFRRHVQPRLIAPLATGALLGLPLGTTLLTTLDGPLFRAGVGLIMVLLATALLTGWTRPIRNQRVALYSAGFLSGLLGGSTSLSGPPVILFLSNQNTPRDLFRANIVAYFALFGMAALALFSLTGLITRTVILSAVTLAPILFIGTFVGVKAARHISETAFKRFAMTCAAIMGAVLLAKNLSEVL